MNRILLCGCSTWLAWCMAVAVLAGDGETFRYKAPDKDHPHYEQTTQKTEQTQTVGEQKFTSKIEQTSVNEWRLEEVDEQGNMKFRSETKRLKASMKTEPLGDYKFDSQARDRDSGSVLSEQLNPVYERISGIVVAVTLSPRGEVKSVTGFQEVLADLLKDNPLAAQFAGGGSDEAARLGVSDGFIVFSEGLVKPGESWETDFAVDLPRVGKAKGKRIYKYIGPDKVGELATAKFSVTLELSVDVDVKADGTTAKGTLSARDSDGTVQFDPERGRVVSMSSSFTIAGDLAVTAGDANFTVSTSQQQSITRTRLDKLPE